MHAVRRESHARRKADGNVTGSEDTEVEERSKGEMDNFQDLQLGSMTPVVCHKDNSPSPSPT
jgi:ribosome assembly protein YihI (activator of Der GTPase)